VVRERIVAAYAANPASWHARYLRESMARAEGDVDTIVAIYAAELDDRGLNHLRIASELEGAGRGGEALRWAERGLREAAHPDQQLADYLARRYAAAGRQADVLDLRRDRFQAERSLTSYQALREAATACGVARGAGNRAHFPERGPACAASPACLGLDRPRPYRRAHRRP
jgi:uncharacterized Zn finger protein